MLLIYLAQKIVQNNLLNKDIKHNKTFFRKITRYNCFRRYFYFYWSEIACFKNGNRRVTKCSVRVAILLTRRFWG